MCYSVYLYVITNIHVAALYYIYSVLSCAANICFVSYMVVLYRIKLCCSAYSWVIPHIHVDMSRDMKFSTMWSKMTLSLFL